MNIFDKIKYQPLNQNDLEADNHHIIEDKAVEREKINFIDYLNNLVSKKRTRYSKVILILAVIGLLLLGCVFFIFLRQDGQNLPQPESLKVPSLITLQGIINGSYEPTRFNGTWVSDDQILMRNIQGHVVLFNVTDNSTKTLLNDKSIIEQAYEVNLSSDEKYLMISFNLQKMYRHSYYAHYLIYDIETHEKIYLTDPKRALLSIQLVKWAPQGNGFAYVLLNDIYYKPTVTSDKVYRISYSGDPSTIYNGICDWVYEEEIFSDTTALWFSPDGKKLAYVSFNDTEVDVMSILYYGEPGSLISQYPQVLSLRYPKPGRKNPTVTLHVVHLNEINGKLEESREVPLSSTNLSERVISAVTWASNDVLSVCVMNRVQNQASVFFCDIDNFNCREMFMLKNENGWIDFTSPRFSSSGDKMIFIKPEDQGDGLGPYRHIVRYDETTRTTQPLTRGKFTVIDILGWNENKNEIYFLATEENQPINQQLFKIKDSEDTPQKPECLSCHNEGIECTFGSAVFSSKYSYFVQSCSGNEIPIISIFTRENKKLFSWERNERLSKLLEKTSLPEVMFLKVPVARGMEAQVKLLLPLNVDKSGKKKYPLLVNVYGGPNSNQVYNRFRITWETYFCLQNNVIIAYIDGRGSGLKGDDMLFSNYRNLGTTEIYDQQNVTYHLQNNFPFIDRTRTAIWGWSYGGYATAMALATDKRNVFKCGTSVAPVTDWIYYDSLYTERFMGLPSPTDNIKGYIASSLMQHSANLANKMFFLIHGTLDDNVHYQQSMMLSRNLELHDILFKQQSYPDEVHSLSGVRLHFHHTLEKFFLECFA